MLHAYVRPLKTLFDSSLWPLFLVKALPFSFSITKITIIFGCFWAQKEKEYGTVLVLYGAIPVSIKFQRSFDHVSISFSFVKMLMKDYNMKSENWHGYKCVRVFVAGMMNGCSRNTMM